MIYGRLIKSRGRKKGPVLTEPRSTAAMPSYPVIRDHLGAHIQSTEKAISDIYSSKKPTSLKIQSLSKNLGKLNALHAARKTKTGIFTKPDRKRNNIKTRKDFGLS